MMFLPGGQQAAREFTDAHGHRGAPKLASDASDSGAAGKSGCKLLLPATLQIAPIGPLGPKTSSSVVKLNSIARSRRSRKSSRAKTVSVTRRRILVRAEVGATVSRIGQTLRCFRQVPPR